ncbi:MAG: BamA/TamA family outer membrane protein [Chitinophagaceae bacterium]|nr:BamA/TamA family outer membrane protein [Chitinophagaceae bacterium]
MALLLKKTGLSLFFWVILFPLFAQPPAGSVIIGDFRIDGNTRTRNHIIIREMPFKTGDTLTLEALYRGLQKARENIYNTKLFKSVEVYPGTLEQGALGIHIKVTEQWYTYPLPYIELADRSLNAWIDEHNASLDRLSYGIRFIQKNLSGRNDNLELVFTTGFDHQVKLLYTTPYLSRAMQSRIRFEGGTHVSREIPYGTSPDNRQEYYQGTEMSWRQWYLSAGYIIRKGIHKSEWLTFRLDHIKLADTILTLNPDFFYGNPTHQYFPTLSYKLRYDKADNVMYPLRGYNYEINLKKQGLDLKGGVNSAQVTSQGNYYIPLGNDWFASAGLKGGITLPFDQPYYNTKAMGYEKDVIRGYENYLIDGHAFLIGTSEIKRRLFHFNIYTPVQEGGLNSIPFSLYLKAFSDAGRSWSNRPTQLTNKWLWGGGIGLDIVTIYDISLSINFAINSQGEAGLFFHKTP